MNRNTSLSKEQFSVWLSPLDAALLECDGMTRAISILLSEAGVAHEVKGGRLCANGDAIRPHFWIDVPGADLRIDFRARMWLRGTPFVPHGVFEVGAIHASIEYIDEQLGLASTSGLNADSAFMFTVLTGAALDNFMAKLPLSEVHADA